MLQGQHPRQGGADCPRWIPRFKGFHPLKTPTKGKRLDSLPQGVPPLHPAQPSAGWNRAKAPALDGLREGKEGSRSHATAAGRELEARQPPRCSF